MDFGSQTHLLHAPTQASSPCTAPPNHDITHSSSSNFPLLVILVLGMMFTILFLVGYYILVVKCCINLHHVHHTRLFSLSRQGEDPGYLTASEPRGLEEAVIRLIPVIHYKAEGDTNFGDCAVCLSEFQQDEKLRVIPNCSHVFHIDCIDVWLQNNTHCPLCRRTVSLTGQVHVDQLTPISSSHDQSQNIENHASDEGFVVIDLDGEVDREQNLEGRQELPTISVSSLLEQKKAKKLHKVTSLGDECIGIRAKGERLMRRSFSMDSSVDTKFYGEIQQHEQVHEINTIEGYGSRVKRSFFSFGHGSRSRSSVQPVSLDP